MVVTSDNTAVVAYISKLGRNLLVLPTSHLDAQIGTNAWYRDESQVHLMQQDGCGRLSEPLE